jgi:regulator of protease activity HflC (stomatin/prohibitin superfamily)
MDVGVVVVEVGVILALTLAIICFLAFALAKSGIFFAIVQEGTAVPIERSGGGFDHFIMNWKGYTLNDPRQPWYNPAVPEWEVIPWAPADLANPPSIYRFPLYWLAPLWRLLERFGIYWYGFYPFKQIGYYMFDWTEKAIDEKTNDYKPWHRQALTSFIFVKSFVYWITLTAAEDKDNIPVDLDYLLTVQINNPYKSLYTISNWLNRLSADANNEAKIFVGDSTFEELKSERRSTSGQNVNDFAKAVSSININLPTEMGSVGTRESYGATIKAVAMDEVTLAGSEKESIAKATVAKITAQKNAEAAIATAEGNAKAFAIEAEGRAKAVKTAADAEKYAVDTVYSEISKYGPQGIAIRQLQAMETAAKSGGQQIIWGNNPLMPLAEAARTFGSTVSRPNPTPTAAAQPTEETP